MAIYKFLNDIKCTLKKQFKVNQKKANMEKKTNMEPTAKSVILPVNKLLKINNYTFSYQKEQRLVHSEYDFVFESQKRRGDFFKKEVLLNLNDDVIKYRDEKGREVLSIYESVPTFDSGDREWDSFRKIYIIKEKNSFTGVYLAGGYKLAGVLLYTNIECTDEKTKELLRKADMI